jgi:hypothetical protein
LHAVLEEVADLARLCEELTGVDGLDPVSKRVCSRALLSSGRGDPRQRDPDRKEGVARRGRQDEKEGREALHATGAEAHNWFSTL